MLLLSQPSEKSLPDFQESPMNEPRQVHCKHSKRPDHDAVYTLDLKIAQDLGLTCLETDSLTALRLFCVTPCQPETLVRVCENFTNRDKKFPSIPDLQKSHRRCTLIHFNRNGRQPLVQPRVEAARGLRWLIAVTKHTSLVLISELPGETDQLTEGEEHKKRSLIQSLLMNVSSVAKQ